MTAKYLSLFLIVVLFLSFSVGTEILKKSDELPCHELGCTVSPTAVSPKSVVKRDTEVLKKSQELPCHDLGCTVPPTAVSPKSMLSKRASDFVGDASYPVTEPPKDSVTPLGVEKESWLPRILGLGTR